MANYFVWAFQIVSFLLGCLAVIIGGVYVFVMLLDALCSHIDRFLAKRELAMAFLEWYHNVYIPQKRSRKKD